MSALGLREGSDRGPVDVLTDAVAAMDLVIVLDTCEHVLAGCRELALALLPTCPGLRILATSREPLGIEGEVVFPVAPLAVDAAALELFEQRARSVRPDFVLTAANTSAVTEICRQLDGLPLAIELAAGRVAGMSLEQISARLRDRLSVLTGGRAGGTSQHRTMHGAIEWSFGLLTGPERTMLLQLSVFHGGFDLDAAETVCTEPPLQDAEAAEVLHDLCTKSMVMFGEGTGGEARYRLLEPIRQFAAEILRAEGDADRLLEAHAGHYLLRTEAAVDMTRGPDAQVAYARLQADHDNTRAALAWLLSSGRTATAAAMAAQLWPFWLMGGHWTEGRRWLEQAIEATPAQSEDGVDLRLGAGLLAFEQGDYGTAKVLLTDALEGARAMKRPERAAHALHGLGDLRAAADGSAAARAVFLEELEVTRTAGDHRGTARALHSVGFEAMLAGRLDEARADFEAELEAAEAAADLAARAQALCDLGDVAALAGDAPESMRHLEQSLAIHEALANQLGMARALQKLANAAARTGRMEESRRLTELALEMMRRLGSPRGLARVLCFAGDLARQAGDDGAGALYDEAAAVAGRVGDGHGVAASLIGRAELALAQGNSPNASSLAGEAREIASRIDNHWLVSAAEALIGRAARRTSAG